MSINLQSPQKVIQAGFSLMELLVVVAIMATIAGIGISTFGNTDDIQRTKMTRIELAELATAVKQLRIDTGFWLSPANQVSHTDLFDWSVLTNTQWGDEDVGGLKWNPVTRRGWRGPYIQSLLDKNIRIIGGSSLALNGLNSGESGDYLSPFFGEDNAEHTVLIDPHGGPYALLFLNGRNVIVSRGSNGVFDLLGGTEDEGELYYTLCEDIPPDPPNPGDPDDLVACP